MTVHWKHRLPPFLLGGSLGMAGLVAAGLLLYGGPGFLPALVVILAILLVSLGSGLAFPGPLVPGTEVEQMRGRWFRLLVVLAAAALFAGSWEVFRGFGAHGVTQAVGLALLVALPFHFGGSALAAMARVHAGEGAPPSEVAAAALTGSAVGLVLLGYVLFPVLSPTAILLVALVFISSGALVHGWALDEMMRVDQVATRTGPAGRIRTERWVRGTPRTVRRALRENGRLRALVEDADGRPVLPEELAVVEAFSAWDGSPDAPRRILCMGMGAAVLGRYLQSLRPGSSRIVLDRDPEATRLLEEAVFGEGPGPAGDEEGGPDRPPTPDRRVALNPVTALAGRIPPLPASSADWILVDALSLGATPEGTELPAGGFEHLRHLLAPGGRICVLPLGELQGSPALLETLLERARIFPLRALYVGGEASSGSGVPLQVPRGRGAPRLPGSGGVRRALLLLGDGPTEGDALWPERAAGFLRVSGHGG
ncbi:MAG: hypothetical protein EA352_08280 [Gemmatimonadales bacterium]|nr:MAG: hypothetical protein EA352_08280 [Gemmatimonadales bacterium]